MPATFEGLHVDVHTEVIQRKLTTVSLQTYYSKHKTAFCHLVIYLMKIISPGIYHMTQKLNLELCLMVLYLVA